MRFWLGSHMPSWLTKVSVPLFISHRRLAGRRSLPRALGPWALDSGAFSEINLYGEWTTTPAAYARSVRRYVEEIGRLEWVSPQDWVCEEVARAKTRLSVTAHQTLTVANFVALRELLGMLVVPVLQGGDTGDEYLRCADMYERAGVDLAAEPVVGLGSVCRRGSSREITDLVGALAGSGIRLHGYGVKRAGIDRIGDRLASADSMAWSFRGRHVPGCSPGHRSEANCLNFALAWRARLLGEPVPDLAATEVGG
ncbi:hypothetical protein AB0M43_23860 [Longispora sp. NPDC051575]|uniref:deazapurine DNA modification protein DpdA family protein n=1 Tax=Longispora sp. NPDC051575 TaxID=3154943 RepID=UPI00342D11A5